MGQRIDGAGLRRQGRAAATGVILPEGLYCHRGRAPGAEGGAVHALLVRIKVKAERLEEFVEATMDNAKASSLEPGVLRFDLLRSSDDPTRFLLYEVYRDAEAPARHKETAHYLAWRDACEPMLDGPRIRETFAGVFVSDPRG
ncbi:MAG: antibiotic biosynthesis monooxygenase [Spirochaetia bacterium]|nr:antibiotic biosynthesis monooxygenase [Spirochaetia bacterium]